MGYQFQVSGVSKKHFILNWFCILKTIQIYKYIIYIYISNHYIGDFLAPSYNRTSIRHKRVLPLIFGGLIAIAIGAIAVENAMINDISDKPGIPPSERSVRESLARVNGLMNSFYEKFNDKNKLCSPKLNRHKRQLNPSNLNCPLPELVAAGQNYFNRIEELAAELRGRPETITTDVSNDNRHAVLDYTTIRAPANQNHPQPIDLTVTIRANLTYDNTAQNLRASSIHPAITERMQEMDWYHGGDRNTNDERGHLLADSLGGPSLPWNFVPQSPSVNRAASIRGTLHVTYVFRLLEQDITD